VRLNHHDGGQPVHVIVSGDTLSRTVPREIDGVAGMNASTVT
jgi:hypothetical protein